MSDIIVAPLASDSLAIPMMMALFALMKVTNVVTVHWQPLPRNLKILASLTFLRVW